MNLDELAAHLRSALGVDAKRDVQTSARHLAVARPALAALAGADRPGIWGPGDDCAAIPDGSGYLLLAAEGMWPRFLETEPYFAGYSAVMVNVSDIHAMGGRPIAVVDVVWGTSRGALDPIWAGMVEASRVYEVPIVGGHTNARSPYDALAVAVLGRAARLLSGFAARPGDALLFAVDLRGRMHPEQPFWDASTGADPARLRGDLEILPALAEGGACDAAKDVSMGGVIGTALMLLETSRVGATIDLEAIPRPPGVPLERWLLSFPSYGFVLSARPERADEIQAAFARRDLACACIGAVDASRRLALRAGGEARALWDLAEEPLTGFPGEAP